MNNQKNTHQKHATISRPSFGQFGRHEWAFLGAPCGLLQSFTKAIIDQLADSYRLAYIDADHKSAEDGEADSHLLQQGVFAQYTDKIDYHRLDWKGSVDHFRFRQLFNDQDAVLVNGNHFKAAQQVVFIDPRKKDSLHRKRERLTDVRAFVLAHGQTDIYDFLKTTVPAWEHIPKISIDAPNLVAQLIDQHLTAAVAPLNGLVLAGGKSQRMGSDKALLDYHGQPQQEYMYRLLDNYCAATFLSVRPDQAQKEQAFPTLGDTFTGLGPFGAILSAFRYAPDHAWLITAVDLPLVDESVLEQLLSQRNPSKLATAFHNPATGFPEPLITIWEPRAYPQLLQFLAQGYSCPRKVLINTAIEQLTIDQPKALKNVNCPKDYEEVLKLIKK